MEAWDTAVEFLLIDNRAQPLADAHHIQDDGRCARCHTLGCTAAEPASQALAVLTPRHSTARYSTARYSTARPSPLFPHSVIGMPNVPIDLIVGQALDDLEAERIHVVTALQLVAEPAWAQAGVEAQRYLPA